MQTLTSSESEKSLPADAGMAVGITQVGLSLPPGITFRASTTLPRRRQSMTLYKTTFQERVCRVRWGWEKRPLGSNTDPGMWLKQACLPQAVR